MLPRFVIVYEPVTSPVRVITGSGIFNNLDQSTDTIVSLECSCESSTTVYVNVAFPKLVNVYEPVKSPPKVILGLGTPVSLPQASDVIVSLE